MKAHKDEDCMMQYVAIVLRIGFLQEVNYHYHIFRNVNHNNLFNLLTCSLQISDNLTAIYVRSLKLF